jgi:hypothetical protein
LRPILNLTPRFKLWPQGRSCPPEVSFVPWCWSYPLGVKFSVRPFILLGKQCSPLGGERRVNIPLGDKFLPCGWSLLLGARCEVKTGPLEPILRLPNLQLQHWRCNRFGCFLSRK